MILKAKVWSDVASQVDHPGSCQMRSNSVYQRQRVEKLWKQVFHFGSRKTWRQSIRWITLAYLGVLGSNHCSCY